MAKLVLFFSISAVYRLISDRGEYTGLMNAALSDYSEYM